jgi:hypothetical protein
MNAEPEGRGSAEIERPIYGVHKGMANKEEGGMYIKG